MLTKMLEIPQQVLMGEDNNPSVMMNQQKMWHVLASQKCDYFNDLYVALVLKLFCLEASSSSIFPPL